MSGFCSDNHICIVMTSSKILIHGQEAVISKAMHTILYVCIKILIYAQVHICDLILKKSYLVFQEILTLNIETTVAFL